ncbi:PAS/PAC sensor signal transduction histidine kinase [Pseudodesulfovibrio profundus]|uniref:histidine kinase n=1 Tax=Pseudodesulfovibrio profundus TaxID=57320 RepID=A0A2C8FBK6_9BACT|nr:ATP-binding protein [Pseudodesulfovibrio profundus]SOB60150.1 PAS/PAC sensor signal transduction histidine kinase [Pseudodesulfovibrio profundus]
MFSRIIKRLRKLHISLALKIVISLIVLMAALMVGLFLVNIKKYEETAVRNAAIQADEIAAVVKAGLRTSMRLSPRQDTINLINDVGQLAHIKSITIYDKIGNPRFSSDKQIAGDQLPEDHPLCVMCHAQEPPEVYAGINERFSLITDENNNRLVRIVSPIPNEPGCSTSGCHADRSEKQFLGVMELTASMENIEGNISLLVLDNAQYVIFSLVAIFVTLFAVTYRLVDRPIDNIIEGTRRIALGNYDARVDESGNDELGLLARAINRMAKDVGDHHDELSKQRILYQSLFEGVPCLITVQDRDYRLLNYNQTFAEHFQVKHGDYCYRAYKGRDCKCEVCPVEKTFEDGKSHTTEEIGYYKDGSKAHWIVNTAPIYNEKGEIIAAMEMSLDITQRKRLEEDLKASEQKYCAIFNNIPSAVLAIDADTMDIVDCNQTALTLYGCKKGRLLRHPITDFIANDEIDAHIQAFSEAKGLKRTKHVKANGDEFWASVNTTRTQFEDKEVLLTAITDISERISSEEQLIQTSKMATLGEMATGVAHELNQPLAVLQMVANLFRRKLKAQKPIDHTTAQNMSEKISNNVERATKIINHMREFGRKSDIETEAVRINDIIRRSFDFFSQQLALHDIEVQWQLTPDLPIVQADPNRLEQVFINLMLNARDAIDDRCANQPCSQPDRIITLRTRATRRTVIAEVIDTGTGIDKHILPRLFEPFFTTKEVNKGTGLGLSISYGIIRDCGGTIRASSPSDGGSRFVITLPREMGK